MMVEAVDRPESLASSCPGHDVNMMYMYVIILNMYVTVYSEII